jgi:hypothetical protein
MDDGGARHTRETNRIALVGSSGVFYSYSLLLAAVGCSIRTRRSNERLPFTPTPLFPNGHWCIHS